MFKKIPPIEYTDICPIDHNNANLIDILKNGICLKDVKLLKKNIWNIYDHVEKYKDNFYYLDNFIKTLQELKRWEKFFYENTGYKPLKIQKYWAKRAIQKESFSIIAPTGIGKTTFGLILSNFIKGKVYYLAPSKILINELAKKINLIKSNKKIVIIQNTDDKKYLDTDYDILLTTSTFLHRNFDILPKNFDLIFIDDADSLIRQPRNIDKILKLARFSDEDINKTIEIIDKKRKAKNKNDYLAASSELNINLQNKGMIIAASATLTPRTKRIFLFKELLGFEIGNSNTNLRNIEDLYQITSTKKLLTESVKWIKKLGQGGFVFLNSDFSKDDIPMYLELLNKNNIKAISYENFNNKNKEKFINNEIQVIVGFSNVRNPLTRGIDMPQKIRYALFVGVPKFRIPLRSSYSPLHLFLLGLSLYELFKNSEENIAIERHLNFLKKISFIKEEDVLNNPQYKNIKDKIENIKTIFDQIINNPKLIDLIKQNDKIAVEINNDQYNNKIINIIISDPRAYIQASGRTSRLFPLGLTKGLSLVLTEDFKVLKHLENKLKLLGYDIQFRDVNNINQEKSLQQILLNIDQDRNIVKEVLSGKEYIFQDPITTALIIVESPTKAKTISNFFGKPVRRIKNKIIFYEISIGNMHLNICATLGHFVDLIHNQGFYGVKKTNDNNFTPVFQPFKICIKCNRHLDKEETICEICNNQIFEIKNDLIQNLQKVAGEVDRVYIATDPDAEGEKIALDLFAYLFPFNKNITRIELHEITRKEFLKCLQNPRDIDINLVKSQLVRRISDRWIGFKLSLELQDHFKNLNLSAGRVQTPVLGWILSKEEKLKNKHYYIKTSFDNDKSFSFFYENKDIIQILKKKFKDNNLYIKINNIQSQEVDINPLPPYDTANLLKDAFNFFKIDSKTTMKLAQDLFEQGLITYHRTDSLFVSDFGKNIAYEYLKKKKLDNLIYKRQWGNIGTHECIRPTKALDVSDLIEEAIISGQRQLTKRHLQLYGIIFNRFISSQMLASTARKNKLSISIDKIKKTITTYTNIINNNHLQFFKNIKLTNFNIGTFKIEKISIKKTSKEYHYTQGEIIDKMKKENLGRPSTYSLIIQTLLERKYLISKSGYLIPTKLAIDIYNYLKNKYDHLISQNFTIQLEKDMDLIAAGKRNYQKILLKTFQKIFQNE